jgi:hypothetical protein
VEVIREAADFPLPDGQKEGDDEGWQLEKLRFCWRSVGLMWTERWR